ncbi:hypothetical protein NHX12_010243, partial [Muraenolepis orangiensis]
MVHSTLLGIHLQDVLQGVGLSSASLSQPAADHLWALVDSATVLGVRDTSLSSFIPAINNLTNEVLEAEKSDRRLGRERTALQGKLGAAAVLRKNLQEDLNKTRKDQEVMGAKAEEKLLNMDFVKTKSRELKNRRKIAEDQMSSRNMSPGLCHQALMETFEEVTTLKEEIIPLTTKLDHYLDLSPVRSLLYRCVHFSTAEHRSLVVCEGERLILHCKPPRAHLAVYGRGLDQDPRSGPGPEVWTRTRGLDQDPRSGPGPEVWTRTRGLDQDPSTCSPRDHLCSEPEL